ncbi:TOMM system kinase/cyclase fusion protein [Microscilla marina]|uniref:Serine/threonine protein kinase n=1 Tax=Microscilla marina ATCC 23134 TaxID=313606 RepID=A1ZGZ0_MICM2|nr:TOMM system kinase/cyclase fusion protein [Microscilla marina]EAY30259.1 serine/threonine protein kinase [Microscilla marina ATCC 23134]
MINPSIPNYTLLEKIGEGGFGLVYKAKQSNTGQLVAIKVLKNDAGIDEQKHRHQQARFERETQLSAKINHPHIVKLLDKGYTETGELFAVFEYVAGETLKDYIIRNGALPAAETGVLMGQALDALVCAHDQGIVHRDLKPQNLMVSQTGSQRHIKILDFGIGAFTQEHRTKDYKSLTLTKEMVGTPSYSAPEQLRGEPPTVKSDLYAWGLILIECLTGKTVMEGDSIAEIFQQQLQASNVPLPAAILDHSLASLLRRVLEKNPQSRAGDAAKLYEDYLDINFSSIVGKLARESAGQLADHEDDPTLDSDIDVVVGRSAKRQITVLCVKLSLVLSDNNDLSLELLDTIQKDQLNGCRDIAIRYGGHIAGSLGDNICIYYGYPEVSDNDARRAGRAALELVTQTKKRSALLQALHGISLDIRVSLHAGEVVVKQAHTPEGLTPNVAFNLLYQTKEQSVLVSETTKKLLDPFLEFEVAESCYFPNIAGEFKVYALVGERQTEALSFLRPQSAGRQMIGREQEHQVFVQQWQKVKAGEGQAVLFSGQAGIGKSRLTYECKKQLREEGVVVAECRCLPEHENNALYPFFDMLRKHWGLQEGENQDFNIARLEDVLTQAGCDTKMALPILCSWLSVPLSDTYEAMQLPTPEQQKEILMDALEKLILNLGESAHFLLIVEDLHWLDPTSKELLERLLHNLDQQNYLLLLTTRPYFKPSWVYNYLTVMDLMPLEINSVKNLIEGVLEGKKVTDPTVQYISERADGIPLFIEELSQMLLEQGYLVLDNDEYHLQENLDEEAVPVTLQALLNARLDKLGLAKETAQLAAAIGRNFDYDLLVRSSLRDEALVQADLHQLMNADLVYRQRRVQGESYIFRHALIRDAAYDGMPNALQKDTHQRIATTLEGEFPHIKDENPFEVARHFAGAELFSNAADYGLQMVKKQVDGSSNQEALLVNEKVKGWVEQITSLTTKIETELTLNNTVLPAFMAIEGFGGKSVLQTSKRNEELIDKVKTLDSTLSNHNLEALANNTEWALFLNYHFHAKRKDARKIAEKILQSARTTGDRLREVAISPMIAQAFLIDGDWALAKEVCTKVLEIYNEATDVEIGIAHGMEAKSAANFILARIYCCLGYPDKAIGYIENAIVWAEQTKHLVTTTLSYNYKGIIGSLRQDKNMVKQAVTDHNAKHAGLSEGNWVTIHLLMLSDWSNNKYDYAAQYVKDSLASGQHYALGYFEPYLAETYLNHEMVQEAIDLMENSVQRCLKHEEWGTLPMVTRRLALSYYAADQRLSARVKEQMTESLKLAQKQQVKWFEFEALIDYANILLECDEEAIEEKVKIYKQLENVMDFFKKEGEAQETLQWKRAVKILSNIKSLNN